MRTNTHMRSTKEPRSIYVMILDVGVQRLRNPSPSHPLLIISASHPHPHPLLIHFSFASQQVCSVYATRCSLDGRCLLE